MHEGTFVADLAIVLGVAAATAVAARLLSQPTIVGYLAAGLIVGPYIPIPVFADAERIEALAEFGVILVMFAIGLEFRIAKFMRVLPTSGFTGLVQISFLLWCGFTLGQILGWNTVESIFLGSCICISSTMVVSRIFDQQPVEGNVRKFVLGVLVIQDLAAIALIAAMTAVAAGEAVAADRLASTLGQLGVVLLGMLAAGLLVVPRIVRKVAALKSSEILAVVTIGICFVTALLAEKFGYSVALGAFIAGIVAAESGRGAEIEHLIQPVRDMFAAIFFVSIGMSVDPVQAFRHLPTALLVALVVVLAQLVSVSTAGVISGNGLRRSITAGLSLGQIGEFAFILAAIGIGAGAAPQSLQPILVTVAVATAFTTSLFLRLADRAVRLADHLLPRRVVHLLGLYEDWLERFRKRPAEARRGRPVRRALRALAFDSVAVTLLLAFALSWLPQAANWLSATFNLTSGTARLTIQGLVLALSLPLLLGILRNALSLSRLMGDSIISPAGSKAEAAGIAGGTLRIMVDIGVVVGVGGPMVALLRPLTGAAYGAVLLTGILMVMGFRLWRSAGAMEREFRSGVEQVAEVLAREMGEQESATISDPARMPGLDSVICLRLLPGGYAVGKTLAELQLRARTGASVVAIHRGESNRLLPTGRERLEPKDLLALIGTGGAIKLAETLLNAGPTGLSPLKTATPAQRPPGERSPQTENRLGKET